MVVKEEKRYKLSGFEIDQVLLYWSHTIGYPIYIFYKYIIFFTNIDDHRIYYICCWWLIGNKSVQLVRFAIRHVWNPIHNNQSSESHHKITIFPKFPDRLQAKLCNNMFRQIGFAEYICYANKLSQTLSRYQFDISMT